MSEPTVEPVFVHLYDLGAQEVQHWRDRKINYNPFYTGLEVCGQEWSFGMSMSNRIAEVTSNAPRKNPEHKYSLTLAMGYTSLPPREVLRTMDKMEGEWNNNTFNWKTRNCHHFVEALCGRLGVRHLPAWVHEDNISTERVFLRVYNLGQTFVTRWHNSLVKSYGAYHTGVEVYGREWAFGATLDDSVTAVNWNPPGECEDHDFRESLYMGSTSCSPQQVEEIINEMRVEWTGSSYNMLKRNCHNFSEAFCGRLAVARPPAWINDLACALASEDKPPRQPELGHKALTNGK